MTAEILREAAALMRERAEVTEYVLGVEGTPVPWHSEGALAIDFDPDDAAHIAGMSPAVALAVADWLDEAADHLAIEDGDDDGLGHICPTAVEGTECSVLGQSLKVATTYLGRSA